MKTQEHTYRKTHIVFGFYLNPNSAWADILDGQLDDLSNYGLLDAANLHVVVTNPSGVEGVAEIIAKRSATAHVREYSENTYEYWALKYAWDLAKNDSSCRLAYFHSKGISYDITKRTSFERNLTRETFRPWKQIIRLLEEDSIRKIGLFPSIEGWIWFNFWWTTGDYLNSLPEPVISEDRYSHESWLHRTALPKVNDCWSLYAGKAQRFNVESTNKRMRALSKSKILQLPTLRRLWLRAESLMTPNS